MAGPAPNEAQLLKLSIGTPLNGPTKCFVSKKSTRTLLTILAYTSQVLKIFFLHLLIETTVK